MANYGEVLEALKQGKSARRLGWTGKGMSISLMKGSHDFKEQEINDPSAMRLMRISGIPARLFENGHTGTCTRIPHISFTTGQGHYISGWSANQNEQLAEDWEIL